MNDARPEPRRHFRGLLYAGATALLWGVLAIVLKHSLRIAGVETIVCFRFLCAFAVLGAGLAARRPARLRILRRPPWLGILAAALLAANYRFYFRGVELAGANSAQVLIQTAPLLFALIGILFFREALTRRQRLGFAVAVAGFVLFYRDRVALQAADMRGLVAILVAAVTWALWATLQKALTHKGFAPQALNLLTYGIAAVLLFPFADFTELSGVDTAGWLVLGFLGLNTLLAYGALGEALKDAPANQVSMIITLNPILTLAVMALLDALEVEWVDPEPVSAMGYAGAAALVTGVALVVGRRPKYRV